MNTDPRSALSALIAALERHYEAASAATGDDDPNLDAATDRLSAAFEVYDDALFDAFDVATPFVVFDGEDFDDDDDDFEDEFDELDDNLSDEDFDDGEAEEDRDDRR
jgi:hypothetical protein